MGSQRKEALETRFRGLAWDELPLPIAPLVASLMGTKLLRVRRGKERCTPKRE